MSADVTVCGWAYQGLSGVQQEAASKIWIETYLHITVKWTDTLFLVRGCSQGLQSNSDFPTTWQVWMVVCIVYSVFYWRIICHYQTTELCFYPGYQLWSLWFTYLATNVHQYDLFEGDLAGLTCLATVNICLSLRYSRVISDPCNNSLVEPVITRLWGRVISHHKSSRHLDWNCLFCYIYSL